MSQFVKALDNFLLIEGWTQKKFADYVDHELHTRRSTIASCELLELDAALIGKLRPPALRTQPALHPANLDKEPPPK